MNRILAARFLAIGLLAGVGCNQVLPIPTAAFEPPPTVQLMPARTPAAEVRATNTPEPAAVVHPTDLPKPTFAATLMPVLIATPTIVPTPSEVVNRPPDAIDDSITVDNGGAATKLDSGPSSVLANDSDPEGDEITAVLVTGPLHGSVTLNPDGTFMYSHDGSDSESDSFTYIASDGDANSRLNKSQSGIYIDTGLGSAANTVIPANAGIQGTVENVLSWTPAYAGVTKVFAPSGCTI